MKPGTLIFFCGKMGAGKSTRARRMAHERNAVLLSEDEWLAALYPGQITSLDDYIEYARRLRSPIQALVQSLLATGTNVVMDFPANTVAQRDWFRKIYTAVPAPHELVFLDVPDKVCLQQIGQRRSEQPERAATDTAEMFEQVTAHFAPPQPEEGFHVVRATGSG